MSDSVSGRPDLGSSRPAFGLKRPDLGSEWPISGFDRVHFG